MEVVPPRLNMRTVYCAYRGSQAHGTYIPSSYDDVDYMLVDMPRETDCYGALVGTWTGKELMEGPLDQVTYEFRHWVNLLAKGNPNVMSSLWMPDKAIQKVDWPYVVIRENRKMFVTRNVSNAFSGYAYSQMKRMTAFQKYEGYMGAKRKELVDKYGFDVKNASHLLRLLRMGAELLRDGELIVERPDVEQLIAIKKGDVSFPDVQTLADEAWASFREAESRCAWPDNVNRKEVNSLCVDVLRQWFHENEDLDAED